MQKMLIESYGFGRAVIGGREYTSDLVIYPDGRVQDSWRRGDGHKLTLSDIEDLVAAKPHVILAGTGASGMVVPDRTLENALGRMGIDFMALPSGQAVDLYNRRAASGNIALCLHLTC